ncbi:Protein transport protein SEC31, partial [Frankliniella fusca]
MNARCMATVATTLATVDGTRGLVFRLHTLAYASMCKPRATFSSPPPVPPLHSPPSPPPLTILPSAPSGMARSHTDGTMRHGEEKGRGTGRGRALTEMENSTFPPRATACLPGTTTLRWVRIPSRETIFFPSPTLGCSSFS